MKRVCVLPGDGIGPEVVECAVMVLEAATDQLELVHADIGQSAIGRGGSSLPDETLDLMMTCDSSLFGAVTTPPGEARPSPVLKFRRELGLYANLRPVRSLIEVPYRKPIDVVIVRENTEGLYTQDEIVDGEGVTTLRRVSRRACERIVRFAIDYARKAGRERICCVHKSNVLRSSDGLFLSVFGELMASSGAGLEPQEQLVDSAAMHLVTEPERFDVIVTLNLYGDILSDVAAGVAGGLGFAPSGNIGDEHSVFEPAHGSAPDIAGKGVANPTATTLAGAMMLRHIGMSGEAEAIENAVGEVYRAGARTRDVGGPLGSKQFTDLVVRRLEGEG